MSQHLIIWLHIGTSHYYFLNPISLKQRTLNSLWKHIFLFLNEFFLILSTIIPRYYLRQRPVTLRTYFPNHEHATSTKEENLEYCNIYKVKKKKKFTSVVTIIKKKSDEIIKPRSFLLVAEDEVISNPGFPGPCNQKLHLPAFCIVRQRWL